MASNEERLPKIVPLDEQNRTHMIILGFEQELKSITVRNGDSARFEAKIRLLSTNANIHIDRSLLTIEWRLNDRPLPMDQNIRYRFDFIAEENLYWMDIRQCEQEDEGVYTIFISYDHEQFHDESSAYLFVDSEFRLTKDFFRRYLSSGRSRQTILPFRSIDEIISSSSFLLLIAEQSSTISSSPAIERVVGYNI